MILPKTHAILIGKELRQRAERFRDLLGDGESMADLLEKAAAALESGEGLAGQTSEKDIRLFQLIREAKEQGWPEGEESG